MRQVSEPTYQKYIVAPLKRFDQRNSGFSRGATDGDKLRRMHARCVDNLARRVPGKSIVEHAMQVSARTVDTLLRQTLLAREQSSVRNGRHRLGPSDPAATSRLVKEVSRWLGADLVGIAKLNRTWLYSHWGAHSSRCTKAAQPGERIELAPEYQYAIVLIHEMAYEGVRRSPAIESETDLAYSRSALAAASLAAFIRELGYRAVPAGNELALSIPLAVDAGLGELGRMGLLITREFGPRVRISKVFTDLPLVADKPVDIGVQRFCERCRLCAKYCVAHAIPGGGRTDTGWDQSNASGMLKWPIRAMQCFDWWVANGTHCSVCIRVCPWNKPSGLFHRAVRALAERNLLVRLLARMDELLGYGKEELRRRHHNLETQAVKRHDRHTERADPG